MRVAVAAPLALPEREPRNILLMIALPALLVGIIGREVWQVVQARRRGRAAARLHVQIVGLFSIIAAAPAILLAVVASVTLDRGLDRFFSIRTRAVIENSLIVAQAYLTSLPGVGIKTAKCVLMYSLGRRVLPIDTHVARVSQRLGLVTGGLTRDRFATEVEKAVPAEYRYDFHVNALMHGREVCRALRPRCSSCQLSDLCSSAP